MRTKPSTKWKYVRKYVFGVTLGILFFLGVTVCISVFYYAITHSDDALAKGAWGDFVGGTLNPILTFLAFTGVLFSIFLQRLELGLSRRELERSADALERQITSIEQQNFEAAFFQMLNTFNAIVDSIDLQNQKTGLETTGRDCFRVFYTRLSKIYRENVEKGGGRHLDENTLKLSYFNFWKDHQLELGHYFRFLFNVFRYLDESSAGQVYHSRLLRAQLSDQELLILYYNCLSEHGRKFIRYAEKYQIFDNLPTVRLLEDHHVNLMNRRAFGDNPMLNSTNARLDL